MVEKIKVDGRHLERAPKIELSRREIICGLAAGSVVPIVSGCSTNPYTGEQELNFFSDAQIGQMAATAWSDMKAQTPQTSNSRVREQVMRTWNRTVQSSPKANEQWDVAVFDTDDVNAFVMPGNRVGVYRGMLELAENDDQLSTVLGHEIGHSVYNHAGRRMTRTVLAQAALVAGQVAVTQSEELSQYGNLITALGGAAMQFGVILPYSRQNEYEADRAGVDYMHRAGYDVRQSIRLWELMDAKSSGQRPPEFNSTHPEPGNRANALVGYINANGYALI
ncbi:MAG: M48 family metalloprotease [Pseudomonadota bacterium]